MKLHLPIAFSAALMITAPFTAYAEYIEITMSNFSNYNTASGSYALTIDSNETFNRSINNESASWYLSSGQANDVSVAFSEEDDSFEYLDKAINVKSLKIENFNKVSFDYVQDPDYDKFTYDGGYDYVSYGSAIKASKVEINNNKEVSFADNNTRLLASGSYAVGRVYGGALDGNTVIFDTNDKLVFKRNEVEANTFHYTTKPYGYSYGGALSASNLTIRNTNLELGFERNVSRAVPKQHWSGCTAYGGAIFGSTISIVNNAGNIKFEKNVAESEDYAYGGAIYSSGVISFANNADIMFTGNAVISSASFSTYYGSYAFYGGAIFLSDEGSLSIIGNDSVSFEKNYEKVGTTYYRLRSIYCKGKLSLAAKADGHITFRDSVYSKSAVSLNANYEDANGVTQKATGDIVFSGKYTEEHLKEVKGGVAGTATEIANSRTSELLNTVNLYGGTLRVEDKAILKTHAINIVAEGNATMKVLDAEVNASTYDVNINSTGQLTLGGTDGSAKLTAKNINVNQGATLSTERTEVPKPVPAITLAAEETVSIFNEKLGGVASGNLNLAAGSTYKANGAHLSVINGILTLNATEGEKINLVLTLGAQYDQSSQIILFTDVNTIKFVLDNITTTNQTEQPITTNASDYFTGDWINEHTSLVYDAGTVYVRGVNRVIPEPHTATLSLLALAVLVAKRRRK